MTIKPYSPEQIADVYIDESSTQCTYCVIGALVLPQNLVSAFSAEIVKARGEKFPPITPDGKLHSFKWEKAKGHDQLVAYTRVIDTFFNFFNLHRCPVGTPLNINCVVVHMSKRNDKQFNFGDADLGFNKDVNCLCVHVVGRKYPDSFFHLYPDKRTTKQPLLMAQSIMNSTLAKHYGTDRFMPFRKLDWAETEEVQALQVVDIVIGAIAYKLNGEYDKTNPPPNKTKKALCEMILKRAKIKNVFRNTDIWQKRVTLFHRDFSK